MSGGSPVRVMAFELRRRWHGGRLRVALVLMAAGSLALGLGVGSGHLRLGDAVDLYGYLYVVTLSLVFRFDLAHDMDRGFADILAPNLLGTGEFTVARILAGLLAVLQFAVPAAALTALVPGLDLRFAAWCGALWVVVALAAAPFVLLAELWLRTRLPVLAVALLAMILLLVTAGMGSPEVVSTLLGVRWLTFGAFGSLAPLAWRALLVGGVGLAALLPLADRHWAAR